MTVAGTLVARAAGIPRGRLRVPGDKSISHRAVLLAALAEGESVIEGFLEAGDTLATVAALRALGVAIEGPETGRLRVRGAGLEGLRAPSGPLDLGNSGTAMRLLAGVLAGRPFASELTGDASLSRRPMGRVIEPLAAMGARIEAAPGGRPPLRIAASAEPLAGIDYPMPVASAQVKSCLLLAGLRARGRTCVGEPAPTRDHTERMLAGFGWAPERAAGRVCVRGGARLAATRITVPGDLSSAAFLMVAAAICPGADLAVAGVGVNPTRAGILALLRRMGASVELGEAGESGGEPYATVRVRGAALRGIEVEPHEVPGAIDEFPALFVAAACAEGVTRVRGAGELRVKESDRIEAMAAVLAALGVEHQVLEDGMVIRGRERLDGGRVESRGDHRVAMAAAIAALRATGPVTVEGCASIETSFPGFAAAARACGLELEPAG